MQNIAQIYIIIITYNYSSPFLQAHEGLRPSQGSPGIWGAAGGGEWHGEAVTSLPWDQTHISESPAVAGEFFIIVEVKVMVVVVAEVMVTVVMVMVWW